MSKKTDNEIEQIIGAYFNEFIGMHTRFVDYVNKHERIGTLTRAEVEFLNSVALAIQLYKDSFIKHKKGKRK